MPNSVRGRVIADQIMRSATSVGANCRATRRKRARAEFIAKIGVVEEEADETAFCLDKSDVLLEHIPLVYRSVTKEERLAIVE